MITRRQQIAIKQEAAAGTAETLAAANVILTTGVAEYSTDVTMTPREALSASLSPRGSVVGSQKATIRFKQYLRGTAAAAVSDATASDFTVPFYGCGILPAYSGGSPNEIATYKPSSSLVVDETTGAYCTVGLYQDGKLYRIHGAVGNCVLTFTTGMPVLAEYEFTGCYNAPTDTALLSGMTYPTVIEPAFLGASLSLIGTYATARISSMKFDFGNTVAMRPYPNTSTGFYTAQITGRNPTGSLDPEEVLAATNNFWSQWIAGTAGIITTGNIGSVNYNTLNFSIPVAHYTKAAIGDRDGLVTVPLEFEALTTTAAGDDEWNLVTT